MKLYYWLTITTTDILFFWLTVIFFLAHSPSEYATFSTQSFYKWGLIGLKTRFNDVLQIVMFPNDPFLGVSRILRECIFVSGLMNISYNWYEMITIIINRFNNQEKAFYNNGLFKSYELSFQFNSYSIDDKSHWLINRLLATLSHIIVISYISNSLTDCCSKNGRHPADLQGHCHFKISINTIRPSSG